MNIYGSLTLLDFVVIAGYLVSVVSIGMWVSFRRRGSEDLFLAGRSLGWGNVGLSIFGTNIGPSFLIAACGAAYSTVYSVSKNETKIASKSRYIFGLPLFILLVLIWRKF